MPIPEEEPAVPDAGELEGAGGDDGAMVDEVVEAAEYAAADDGAVVDEVAGAAEYAGGEDAAELGATGAGEDEEAATEDA
ncbi:MAG: hypothetical protein M1830_000832 [Pleopsidium flavum]|nr:MAG: hypothetical protein M1830_000832 [Pleopsidium flavum]